MPTITFITHDEMAYEVEASTGSSLMQAAVDNGIDGILAECGGACSCGTCHCYIDEARLQQLPKPSGVELYMLECVLEPQSNSRLSCQISVTEELDGLIVRVPERQY